MQLTYVPPPTIYEMHRSSKLVRATLGPPGSGKSVGSVMELFFMSCRQRPDREGVRRTRWVAVRSRSTDLTDSTVPTFERWWPEKARVRHVKSPKINMEYEWEGGYFDPKTNAFVKDGTIVRVEVWFRHLSESSLEGSLNMLNSLEATGFWLNEANEIPQAAFLKVFERISQNRYPERPAFDVAPGEPHVTQAAILMDFNAPPEGHWLVKLLDGEEMPPALADKIDFFRQPPALLEVKDPETNLLTYKINPQAENLENGANNGEAYLLQADTYLRTGEVETLNTRLLLRYGKSRSGKPCFVNFNRDEHVSANYLDPKPMTTVLIGIDTSGHHPCAVFAQYYKGQWEVQDGLYADGEGFAAFTEMLISILASDYAGCRVLAICDPANAGDSHTKIDPISYLVENGIDAIPAPTNDIKLRIGAVNTAFHTRDFIVIDPTLTMLINACDGGYCYKESKIRRPDGSIAYLDTPDKRSDYSHWADALQYLCLHIFSATIKETDLELGRRMIQNALNKRAV